MTFPKQSPPIQRPHFVQPASCVDVENGRPDDLVSIRIDLLHGANYNDPAAFAYRSYNHVMYSSWHGFGNTGRFF
jgi:cyanobactin biosynthesis protein (PatB/AcyB/McaB family)